MDGLDRGSSVPVPEIANHEVRRELIRAGRTAGTERLDAFIEVVEYVPMEMAAMCRAAVFRA